jgi:lauroyl/myristoyl acyltransferase
MRVGGAAGAAGHRLGIKRHVVESNIRLAFPEASDEWVRNVATESYRHLGREMLMMLRLSWMSRDEVLERTRIVNEEPAAAEYRKGNGVVVVTGHLGNWEIGGAAIAARGYRITAVAKRAANPLFYQRIMAARARVGLDIIDFDQATRPGLRALRDGKVLALAADQHAGRAGVRVLDLHLHTHTQRTADGRRRTLEAATGAHGVSRDYQLLVATTRRRTRRRTCWSRTRGCCR